MVNKLDIKQPEVKMTLTITPGPVGNYQRTCWKKWWAARIAEVKSEARK
jgi:hypothetical protein